MELCNWCYYWKECPVKNGSSPSEYMRQMVKIVDPKNSLLYEEYLNLRWLLLRQPLGGERGSEVDEIEEVCEQSGENMYNDMQFDEIDEIIE